MARSMTAVLAAGMSGLALCATAQSEPAQTLPPTPYPILFVTQFPIGGDFAAIASVFANHRGNVELSGRGGDLYIRYPDGSLRNLTQEAGFGNNGGSDPSAQAATSIAVRDPAVFWDGTRAIFSMVIGAPTQQFVRVDSHFQLYEVSGLQEGQTATIVKVPGQPANRNNVNPAYLSDNSIIFASDNARNGADQLYPQLDEYEEQPTPTGLWRLDPDSGRVDLLQYAVSGSFNPIVDSFGRVVFTRWDHLQRDQQNDYVDNPFGIFNYASETSTVVTSDRSEVFPEPRGSVAGGNVNGFSINQFFPWTVNQDGTAEETLNHVGRHELLTYIQRTFSNDGELQDLDIARNALDTLLQLREDPAHAGRYFGIAAPEFYTQASGQIVRVDAAPDVNPATMAVTYVTSPSDRGYYAGTAGDPVPADFSGHFRNPLPLSDGSMIAAHTSVAQAATSAAYAFRLRQVVSGSGGYLTAGAFLTAGIAKQVSYWDPDKAVTYNGPFWELSPVEVRRHTVPPPTAFALHAPEQQAFTLENVDADAFRDYLRANGLGLIVVRNVTSRDAADKQQPFNLRVPGGVQTTAPNPAKVYDIANVQFFQGDQIRSGTGLSGGPGRRVLAQVLHDGPALIANAANPGGPAGSASIASDGSLALFVPARRALAWHSTAPDGSPVVRERYWITLQPGEIRACDGCHGVNQLNQAGQPPAENVPIALRALLARWRSGHVDLIYANGLEDR